MDEQLTCFRFRPFKTSTTFANLQATRCGVFHVTDDVGMIARSAIAQLDPLPALFPAHTVEGMVIASACRWYEFEVMSVDESHDRTEIETRLTHTGRLRDFFGFNRAKHAVLETAILATRVHLLPLDDIYRQVSHFRTIVDKTAGQSELQAFNDLCEYIDRISS